MIKKLVNVVVLASLLILTVGVSPIASPISVAKADTAAVRVPVAGVDYVPGELLVKFKSGFAPDSLFLAKYDLNSPKKITDNLYLAKLGASSDVLALVSSLKLAAAVQYAEPDFIYSLQSIPNDPYFNYQTGLLNAGGWNGVIGADIKAVNAWNISGSPVYGAAFNVGIIDSGVRFDHEDLAGNVFDLGDFTSGGVTPSFPSVDINGHGTFMAGIIGEHTNNGLGAAGINSSAKMYSLKAFSMDNGKNADADEEAILAAINRIAAINSDSDASNDIRLVNMSWGGYNFSQFLLEAIQRNPNLLFIAAAGNGCSSNDSLHCEQLAPLYFPLAELGTIIYPNNPDPWSVENNSDNDLSPFYPASYDLPNIISVTSSDNKDLIDGNYGVVSVDLAAPGETDSTDIYTSSSYHGLRGTSVATAFVTGAASFYWGSHPEKSNLEVKAAILASVDRSTAMAGRVLSGGRLNLYNMLTNNFASTSRILVPNVPHL